MKVGDKVRVRVPERVPVRFNPDVLKPGMIFDAEIVEGPDCDGDFGVSNDRGDDYSVSPEWCELLSPVGVEVTRVSTCKVQLTALQIAQLFSEKAERAGLTHLTDGSGRVEVTWYEA